MSQYSANRLVVFVLSMLLVALAQADIPHLASHGTAVQLVVKGKPMLLLGGELGNSSASDPKYMTEHWARLRNMHLNTVLVPVYWELIEPDEHQYDWTSVDAMIKAARVNDLKLVLLWFGTWKNSMSTYVPSWIKHNSDRFPHVRLSNGQIVEILSVLSPEVRNADAHAFSELLKHIRHIDEQTNTVLMVQVENEIGMLPDAREHGTVADGLFVSEPVPQALINRLIEASSVDETALHRLWKEHGSKHSGAWSDLFGESDAAAEIFQAWHYAQYANAIATAGKAEYPLPMYVNAAMNRPGKIPGEYPSGGPLPHLLDVWKAAAPSIDILAPDIYFPNFVDLAGIYKRRDNPLFVPEANDADRPEVAANASYAFSKLDAIGFGPFAVESVDDKPSGTLLADSYAVLQQLSPFILTNQGSQRMSGFKPRVLYDGTILDAPVTETIGDYKFTVSFVDPFMPKANQDIASHGGLIIQTSADEYVIAGRGLTVTFETRDGAMHAGIDVAEEGLFDSHGQWIKGRRLNGDQTHQGRHIRLEAGKFQIQRIKLYKYH